MTQIKKWERVSSEVLLDKFNRKIERVNYLLPGGSVSEYYIKVEGPGAGVLALTTDGMVIVTRLYRPGPDSIEFELPGGFVDPGENPDDAVKRELLEETGYTGNFQKVAVIYENSYSTMRYHCYVATDCIKANEPVYTDEENIEVVLMEKIDFRNMIKSGKCGDIHMAYVGLDYLKLL